MGTDNRKQKEKMEEIVVEYNWVENTSHVCYEELGGSGSNHFCGLRDNCQGIVLPLFLEITWSTQLRAALYFIGLLYRSV